MEENYILPNKFTWKKCGHIDNNDTKNENKFYPKLLIEETMYDE